MTRDSAAKLLPSELAGRRVFVAGHRGRVGAAVVRRLVSERCEVLTADRRTLDLARQAATEGWLRTPGGGSPQPAGGARSPDGAQRGPCSSSRLTGVRIEELLPVDLVVGDHALPFGRNQLVDELLAKLLLDAWMLCRTDQHDAILVEQSLVTLHRDHEIALVVE